MINNANLPIKSPDPSSRNSYYLHIVEAWIHTSVCRFAVTLFSHASFKSFFGKIRNPVNAGYELPEFRGASPAYGR